MREYSLMIFKAVEQWHGLSRKDVAAQCHGAVFKHNGAGKNVVQRAARS